jgi:DNA-binding FadR family transcriptional regulator
MAQRPITAAHDAAERLRRQILQGELKPGASLPGERELSERLGVSRLTLRAALTELQAQGLIEKVHGAGNRVLDYRETGGIELIAYLARQAIDGGVVPLPLLGELLELRRMVAIELLGLVCQRATLMVYDRLLELLESRDPTKVRELASRFFEPLDRRTLDRLAEASAIAASARPDSERAERTSPDVKASAGNDGATKRARKASEPTASRETTSRAAAREPKTKKKSRVRE